MSKVLKCDVCQTTMQPTSWSQHLVGKRHLLMLARQRKAQKSSESKIVVSGFRQGTSESALASYFSAFASIKEVNVDKETGSSAIVLVQDQSSIDRICSRNHCFDGMTMKAEPYSFMPKPKKRQKPEANPEICELESSVMKQMSMLENVDAQMRHLAQHMGLDATDYAMHERIRASLENLFQEFFPGCMLSPYGSSANHFGQKKSSDLDLFLDLAFEPSDDAPLPSESGMGFNRIIKNLKKFRLNRDPFFMNRLRSLSRKKLVLVVGAILQKCATGYEEVFAVTNARCPIVQCIHSESGLKCDLSMKNQLALFNTELLLVYQKLDPRVHPLIFMVRFWGKKAGIVLSNASRLSSYALSMMVVFYLENTVPPVLPTVEHLQLLAEQPLEINGWPCHFCSDPQKIAKTKNSESLESLLKGFFQFYSKINFESSVLCVRTGKMVALDQFVKETADVDESKFRKSMHLQDPFELVHNIAQSASKECVTSIVERVALAHKLMISRTFHKQKTVLEPPAWGLVVLIDEAKKQSLEKRKKIKSKVPVPKVQRTPLPTIPASSATTPGPSVTTPAPRPMTQTSEFHVALNNTNAYLATQCRMITPAATNEDRRNALLDRLASKIREVFCVALRFDCQDVGGGPAVDCSTAASTSRPNKRRSDNELVTSPNKVLIVQQEGEAAKVCGRDQTLLTFRCNVSYPTWNARKAARSELDKMKIAGRLEAILIEAAISDRIIMSIGGTLGSNVLGPPMFTFDCALLPLQKGPQSSELGLTVKLSSHTSSKQFKGVVVPFLSSYVPKIVNLTFFNV